MRFEFLIILFSTWFTILLTMIFMIDNNKCLRSREQVLDAFRNISEVYSSVPKQKEAVADSGSHNILKTIKILCWILTTPKNREKAEAVRDTWGRRCDKLIFMSSENNDSLPSVDLRIPESRWNLWIKTREAFKYVYDHHIDEYQWFYKADDDTYTVIENLRYLLSSYDGDMDSIFLGNRWKYPEYLKQGFQGGGAGYVLSRSALKIFALKGYPNTTLCPRKISWQEDVEMSKCLENLGVMAGDSRDSQNRGRFFIKEPFYHLVPGQANEFYLKNSYYAIPNNRNCCSDLAITFHYIEPREMHMFDYLIYRLHPFGIEYSDHFPQPLPADRSSVPKRLLGNGFKRVAKIVQRPASFPSMPHRQNRTPLRHFSQS